ncbi:hypothetical protein BUZ06_03270 [Staphylococcus gallinarum]|nr:hypothetical protein BUZ05_00060 [Staphylococcus gallinarum]RIO90220.1 hypothetical protein BUZ06_03270 [Staphylococcus gallinarum]
MIYYSYFVLLARFPRGQLQPVVFRSSCSLRSLAKTLFNTIWIYNEILLSFRIKCILLVFGYNIYNVNHYMFNSLSTSFLFNISYCWLAFLGASFSL